MAKLVIQPNVVEFLEHILMQTSKDVSIEEVSCNNMAQRFVGKSIAELKVQDVSDTNIVGIKVSDARYVFNPDPGMIISRNDRLFVIGSPPQIKKLRESLEE